MFSPKLLLFSLLIIVLAAFLRIYNLNALPIFADESIYIRWAQVMRAEPTLRFLPLSDGKQPFYMWSVIPVLKVVADPLVAGRLLSGLVGLGTTVGVGLAAYILFKSQRVALMAALMWAVLPYAVFFERMALADGLLVFFVVWGFVFMSTALIHTAPAVAMLAGFSLGFAWLTKSPAMFALALLPSLFFLIHKKFTPRIALINLSLTASAAVIALAMYNVLRLGPEFHMIALRNKDYIFPLSEILAHPLNPLLPHLKDTFQFFFFLLTPIGLVLIIFGLLDSRFAHWRQRLVLSAWLFVPLVVQSFVSRTLTARYLLFTVPFAVVLMAHGLEHMGEHTRKHFLVYAGLALIVGTSLFIDIKFLTNPEEAPLPRVERAGYLEEWTAGYGLREVAGIIKERAKSGPVVVGSEGFFGTPFDALQLYLNDVKNVRVVGVGVWIDSVSDKLQNALSENQVFLVVNSDRFHNTDPEKLGLKLIGSYPKATKPDATTDHLLFFEVLPR